MMYCLSAQFKVFLQSINCRFVGISVMAILVVAISAQPSTVNAAINESFTFQGKIVDDDGTNLVNADASCVSVGGADTCDFRVSLYTAVSGGTLVWQETKSNIELYDNDGIFNLFLDCGGTFSSCNQNGGPNFNSGDLFIQVEFDPDGDGDFAEGETFSPRRELSAVPYAFNAKQLDGQEGGSYLRSDATDAYTSGTLSFNSATELNTLSGSTLDVDGDLEIADTSITLNGATTTLNASGALTLLSTGDIAFQADNDTDDYLYFDTTTNIPGLFWEGIAGTDPGVYVTGTELGYRDESDSWVSFDSLAVDNDTTYTAGNGLTLDTGVFKLGGTLSQATTITQGNNNFSLDLTGTGDFIIYDNGSEFARFYDTGTVVFQSMSNIHSGLFQVGDNGQGFDDYLISAYGTQDADAAADTDYGMELYVSTVSDHLSDVLYGLNLYMTNSSSVNSVQRGINLVNSNTTSNSITEALIALDNLETTASTVADGIVITSSGVADGIVDAIDVSATNLTNALNVGQNFILGDGIRQFSSSSTVWTFEDTAGADLMTITDIGSLGNVDVTGNLSTLDLTLSGGDIFGDNSAAIDVGEAFAGNILFYPNGDLDDYLYMNTAANIPGLFWEGIAATDPGIYVTGTELGYRDEADAWVSFDSLANTSYTFSDGVSESGGLVKLGGANIDESRTLTVATGGTLIIDVTSDVAGEDFIIREGGSNRMTFDNDGTIDVSFASAGTFGLTYSNNPTVDFFTISNSGQPVTTDNVDGLSINFVAGDDNAIDSNAGLRLTMTPSNDLDASDVLSGIKISTASAINSSEMDYYGISIDSITHTASNDAAGIQIGSGWPFGLVSASPVYVSSNQSVNGYSLLASIGTTTGAGTNNNVIEAIINSDPADSGDTINGLSVVSASQAQTGSTVNLINLDPAASGNTAGTLNGLRIDSITGSTATETAISIGSGWDTGIDVGSNVVLNIGNSGTDFNTSGGLTLANSLTVTTGGATVSAGGLTVTSGALAVNSDSITSDGELVIDGTTSVVLGTTTNGLRINETFGATSGYLGNARPTKTITLSPEYAGAVLTAFYGAGTDSNITGTMTSDADTTQGTSIRTYYQWERTNSTEHFHTIAVRVTLPSDFAGWQTNGVQVSHITESGTSTNSELDVRIYNENSATIVAQDNDNASTSWASVDIAGATLDDGSSSEWDEAGETAVIYLRLGSQSGNWSRVGDIKLNYYSRF